MSQTTPQYIGNQQYRLQEVIGVGGMGTVYRGMDMRTGDNVAVKLLKADAVMDDPDLVERFVREAEALRQLNHPNIVKVLATIEENNRHYIVMDYVSGGSLSDLLKSQGKMPIRWILKIAIELADALTRAHYLKIIHRDIKPANVLIAPDGTPRLTDFGVAQIGNLKERVTRTGSIVGTPDYLSPEALNGEQVDNRSDIWAFGVMLFEMLTAQRPFEGSTLTQLITKILTYAIPDIEQLRPDAPVALVDLLYRMLEKDREARVPSVRLIGAELEAIMQGDTKTSTAPYVARRSQEMETPHTPRFAAATPISDLPKHNLPAQTTAFVGREDELRELNRLLNMPQIRLVTILAAGGMGKTRLALQTGEQVLDQFPHGVYFVGLAPLTTAESIVPTIAEAVRYVFTSDGRDAKTQLLDFLREKHLLLVMDNFEHLIEGAPIVNDILRAASSIKVLATSRERLNLSGETIFNLEGMDFPNWETPQDAMEYSAVKLFLQSARRVQPNFELNNDNLRYIARICRTVSGMPLGILLAAAWVEALSVEEIADEISSNLDFLETELRDVPERHRSIRAVFEYSWKLLSESERDVFMKLSVFQGGFTRQAAQEVAGATLKQLTSLVNKSLLRRGPDSGRYSIHVLVHQYVAEQFTWKCSESNQTFDRHLSYYSELLRQYEREFNTRKENVIVDAIEADFENMRGAWRYAIKNCRWGEVDKMQHSMLLYYIARSTLLEGANLFRELAEALQDGEQGDTATYWRARVHQAWMASRIGDYDLAWQLSDRAYHYFDQYGHLLEASYALNNMSYTRMMQGDYESSKEYARFGLKYAKQVDDSSMEFSSLANLGYAEFLQGNYLEARNIYESLHKKAAVVGFSATGQAYGLNNLGEVMQAMGDFETANRLYSEAYALFKAANNRRGTAFTYNNLAGVHVMQGKYEEARAIYEETYRLNKEIGDRSGIGHSLSALGNVAFYLGDYVEARRYYQQSLELRRKMGDRRGVADSLTDLADTDLAEKQYGQAANVYSEALQIRREIGDQQGIVRGMVWLGIAQGMSGVDDAEVYKLFQDAYELAEQLQNPFSTATVLCGLGEMEFESGKYNEAKERFQEVLRIALKYDLTSLGLFALTGLAAVLEVEGDKEQALEVIALVHRHPRTFITFLTEARVNEMFQRLQTSLDEPVAKDAIQRGENADAEAVAKRMLGAYI
jgi:serine/threonine protein kinase/predicted ATPase